MAKQQNKVMQELSPYITLGGEFAFSVLIFVLLGQWFDKKFETGNIITILMILFSVIGGFIRMFFQDNSIREIKKWK